MITDLLTVIIGFAVAYLIFVVIPDIDWTYLKLLWKWFKK